MENWIMYGVLAAFCWGSYAIVSKVATSGKYFGIDQGTVALLMLAGIIVVFAANSLFGGKLVLPDNKLAIGLAVLAGVLWAVGQVAVLKAMESGGEVAKLAPIYNTNTLITVVLGIMILQEIPAQSDMVRVVGGALLIIIGAILVSV